MKRAIFIFLIMFALPSLCLADDEIIQDSIINNTTIIPQVEEVSNVKLQGGVVYDEDKNIYLDKNIKHPALNIKPPSTIMPVYTPVLTDDRNRTRSALAQASKLTGDEYYITPIFNYIQESTGNFSYGTYYGATMDSAQMTYSTSIFSRYDTKHCALTGTISTDSQSIDGSYKSMLGISPEIKLTNSLSIRDTIKTYMGIPVRKNQISLIYTPHLKKYIDSLRFELGLSQSFYENGATNSSIEFSTKIKL